MKAFTLIFSMLLLASCQDTLRSREKKCRSFNNRMAFCGPAEDAYSAEEFRKLYTTQVSTAISVGQSKLMLKENAMSSDQDYEFVCDLDISANKQFTYSIDEDRLILRDGISTLNLTRYEGLNSDGIVGAWVMEERTKNVLTTTELIFTDLEELKIRKTCSLK